MTWCACHSDETDQTRIFRGNTRSEGKLLSLFERSTEEGKAGERGKMVKLQEAENRIMVNYESTRRGK